MTDVSARSNLVNFCPEKNLTSNGPKPIRVLTRTKISHSDLRLPLGYLLPDFQPHRSNFFAPPAAAATAAAALFKLSRVDPFGGAPLPLECRRLSYLESTPSVVLRYHSSVDDLSYLESTPSVVLRYHSSVDDKCR